MIRHETARHSLDLFSTSPTKEACASDFLSQKCSYNAPYIAWHKEGKRWGVAQGNCHHWDCPRCGQGRARQEYGRIVEGCRSLAENNTIQFITITCKGKGLTHAQAEAGYLGWTNRFLDACRAKAKRAGQKWSYVQVTERQKRGHPHSHILTTFDPGDIVEGTKRNYITSSSGSRVSEDIPALRSPWIAKSVVSAGLGEQYDISRVQTVEGASRYVAKYLFKPTIFTTEWPKGWKRVRYSQSFPKLSKPEGEAMVLLMRSDWQSLSRKAVVVDVGDLDTLDYVQWQLHDADTLVRLKNKQ